MLPPQRHAEHPTTRLWTAFDPDVTHKARLPILCGVPPQIVDDVVTISTAKSRPAARLMARTPGILRSLAHQTTTRSERCVGHVRGPIQWSETITAWSSGVGVDDVFVCVSPRRDFDVPENRLLVWLLKRLATAGRRCSGDAANWFPKEAIESVEAQGRAAQKLLEHPALRGVTIRKLTGREMQIVRKSRHASTYTPALKLHERVARPFERDEVRALVSRETVEHHRAIMMIVDRLQARGLAVPQMTIRGDFAVSGPIRYRNPSIMVDRRLSARSGLYLGDTALRTPADVDPPDPSAGSWARIDGPDDADELVARWLQSRAAGAAQSASGLVQLPDS
jgi:hypothetical protein